jgi:hypothetical protein
MEKVPSPKQHCPWESREGRGRCSNKNEKKKNEKLSRKEISLHFCFRSTGIQTQRPFLEYLHKLQLYLPLGVL